MSYFNYKDDLNPLPTDNRILVEGDEMMYGQIVSRDIDTNINIVQTFFQSPFFRPVYVTVCSTDQSFIKRCGAYKKSEAMMNWGRVFIAPLAFKKNTEKPVLIHELVHLHICQKVGLVKMIGTIPPWFNEGLAVLVSNGSGAEECTDSEAVSWINNGKSFYPHSTGNFFHPSKDADLPWDVYYRQASLFVDFLNQSNQDAFHQLLKDLENGIKFRTAFVKNFKRSLLDEFENFKKCIHSREKSEQAS